MADAELAAAPAQAKKSDLGVRAASAIVMLAVAGAALWLGGWFWVVFVGLIAVAALLEWKNLARKIARSKLSLAVWLLFGLLYIGLGGAVLVYLRGELQGQALVALLAAVIGVDVGAYFLGRLLRGPKIAPSISPSKTWAGLLGGVIGAIALPFVLLHFVFAQSLFSEHLESLARGEGVIVTVIMGAVVAVVAQAGDFFESWMKRRAGVKDSSNLIPGHGGVFDRVDGLLAVSVLVGLLALTGLAEVL